MQPDDPLSATLQEWIGIIMRRSMHSMIFFLKDNDLSMSQVGALFQINHGKSNVSDLGDGLGITIAAASQMLERLVQQELILRSEDPHDRRVKKLMLTEKGRRTMHEIARARQGWLKDLLSSLSAVEKEQIAASLKILIDRSDQIDQHSRSEW